MDCLNCGKAITNRDATKFCNRECYMEYRNKFPESYGKKKQSHICAFCGKTGISRKPSELRRTVYCSRSCSNKAQSAAIAAHPELRTSQGVELVCENCGKAFFVKPHRAKKARFCSKECAWAYSFSRPLESRRHAQNGKSNPNYRDSRNRTTARLNGLRLFGKKCAICDFDIAVNVHHIVPYREAGTNLPENVIALCPNHHAMADRNLISQEELLTLNRAAIAQQSVIPPLSHQPEPLEPAISAERPPSA